jgi:hypothetical protein
VCTPRQSLDRAFVRAIRTSGLNLVNLAALSGFAASTQLSTFLNARDVPASALNVRRFSALAQAIHYNGPIFKVARRG